MGFDSAATVSHYESGLRSLTVENLLKMAEIYGISLIWVMTGANPNFDPTPVLEAAERMRIASQEIDTLLETLAMVYTK